MAFEELYLEANGIRFHALADGPQDGPLVLLLHGFPELSISWRHQLPALAARGYRAVAPDLRGYGGTARRGPYDLATLAADVRELVRALGRKKAIVAGHDWGGAIAWATASLEPEVVERLVVLNCPPAGLLASEVLRNPRQLARSWYILFFQLPRVPERLLSRNHAAAIPRMLRGGSHVRRAWTPEALAPYRKAFAQPGAASAAIEYYRTAFRRVFAGPREAGTPPVRAPTLIIWGLEDRFLDRALIDPKKLQRFFAPDVAPELRPLPGVGHFVQNEAPERVNEAMLEWLERG